MTIRNASLGHSQAAEIRRKVAEGEAVFGTFLVDVTSPAIMHLVAAAGFDFVMIDNEHGNHDPRELERMIESGLAGDVCVLVRPGGTCDRGTITRSLDAGAGGIVFPNVSTMEQVRQIVEFTKYRPVGRRGVHMMRGHTRHNPPTSLREFMAAANRDLLTIVQIELASAVEIADEIAAADGVDALYVGPGDLGVDLDVPGEWDAPALQEARKSVLAACRKHGKIAASHIEEIHHAPELRKIGVQMMGYGCELSIFKSAMSGTVKDLRDAIGSAGTDILQPS